MMMDALFAALDVVPGWTWLVVVFVLPVWLAYVLSRPRVR